MPSLRLGRTRSAGADVLVLVGTFTRTGSLWDGVAERTVQSAGLAPGQTLVSASLADYGISATLAAVSAGLHSLVVVPESLSLERRDGLVSLGARLVPMREGSSLSALWAEADRRAAELPGARAVRPVQADVDAVLRAAWGATGPVDAFVCGAGTGMTFRAGVAVLAPRRSYLVTAGGPHHVQGFAANLDLPDLNADEVLEVPDSAAWKMRTRLAREEGLLVSLSGAANVAAAIDVAAKRPEGERVHTVVWSSGERDFSLGTYFP